jgi:antitoxin VapB
LPGDEVVMRQEGEGIFITPIRRRSLREVLAGLSPIEEDFAPIEDLPPEPVEL